MKARSVNQAHKELCSKCSAMSAYECNVLMWIEVHFTQLSFNVNENLG